MITEIPAQPPRQISEFPLQPIEVISVLAAISLVIAQFIRFAQVPEFWTWYVLILVVSALMMADFVSGVIHWAGDTWGTEDTRWLGSRFIRPFRFHHAHPLDMLKSNFFTTNGDTALASLPFLLIPFCLSLDHEISRLFAVFLWAVGAWGMWTSQFHQWAHRKRPPRIVGWLQRGGLLLSPRHHLRHHKSPFAINYCITTGWCDSLLTRVRFFTILECVVSGLTGWRPRGETPRHSTSIGSSKR